MTLGELLVKLRQEANLNRKQISEITGLSDGLICEIETGKRTDFKFDTIEKLATLHSGDADLIYKLGKKIPSAIYYQIVNSKLNYAEIRAILKQAGV